jgi:hypothetical protein
VAQKYDWEHLASVVGEIIRVGVDRVTGRADK